MEYLPYGLTLRLVPGAFPLSTDSVVLGHFVRLPKNARVLDLGAGCGTLGLLLCAADQNCHVTGLEIDPVAHEAALENIRRNDLAHRMNSVCADLRQLTEYLDGESFTTCVSNPPYFTGGPASRTTPIARRDDCCPPEALFRSAAAAVKYGGDFYLVHKPDKLAQLIACAAAEHLEAKRLRLVRHKEGGPITLILLQFRKGGKPGLIIDEACLFDTNNNPTSYFQEVYHIQGD